MCVVTPKRSREGGMSWIATGTGKAYRTAVRTECVFILYFSHALRMPIKVSHPAPRLLIALLIYIYGTFLYEYYSQDEHPGKFRNPLEAFNNIWPPPAGQVTYQLSVFCLRPRFLHPTAYPSSSPNSNTLLTSFNVCLQRRIPIWALPITMCYSFGCIAKNIVSCGISK